VENGITRTAMLAALKVEVRIEVPPFHVERLGALSRDGDCT
jgi:hypothetical protein